jgi:hypothetical protein
MRKALVIVATALGLVLLVFVGLWILMFWQHSSVIPRPSPPSSASNVLFLEINGWQTWNYSYKFDASPGVCSSFAISLMKQQSLKGTSCTIQSNAFTTFPIKRHIPPWFDVDSVTNGILYSGDNWIYAVVDTQRGRLYYYNSH